MGALKGLKAFHQEVMRTVKLPAVEERFDLYFSRPFGLLLARGANRLHLTPNIVSFLSLLSGIAAGVLFYFRGSFPLAVLGCFLLTLAGLLDSADGQLARMQDSASDLGMILDGTVDNFVFVAVYLGATLPFVSIHGWWMLLVAFAAGMVHSVKSLVYDLYKWEHLYYFTESETYKIIDVSEIKTKLKKERKIFRKILLFIYLDYVKKQNLFSTRNRAKREEFSKYAFSKKTGKQFKSDYERLFSVMLAWWALFCGTNFHRTLMMVFILFGRFDLYLISQIFTLIPFFILRLVQKRKDRLFLARFS